MKPTHPPLLLFQNVLPEIKIIYFKIRHYVSKFHQITSFISEGVVCAEFFAAKVLKAF